MGVRLWDRLANCEIPELPRGQVPLGRFITLNGPRDLSADGKPLRPGDYLAIPGRWTLWDAQKRSLSRGSSDTRAVPGQTLADTVLALHARLTGLGPARGQRNMGPAQDWLEISPLMVHGDTESMLKPTSLDDALDEHLGALEDVCHNPADRLQVVNRRVPVGAARRIVPATITRLSGHSEDWNRLRPDGVEPKVVLSPFREPNLDFYEYRVAARLVGNLWQEIGGRLAKVTDIDSGVAAIDAYVRKAAGRQWRLHGTLFRLIAGTADNQTWRNLIAARKAELAALLDKLDALRGTRLLPGVDRHAEIGTALRATNLFINEHRYRRVRDLWHAWVADHTGADSTPEVSSRMTEFSQAFATYTVLLLLHALDHLGFEIGTAPVGRGLTLRLGGMSLAWLPPDVFELGAPGRPFLRIVPLPHAITGEGRASAVLSDLRELTATTPDVRTLIVYPGTATERETIPLPTRLAAFSGAESVWPGTPCWGALPVSPVEIDSMLRLARSIATCSRRSGPVTIRSLSTPPGHTPRWSKRTGCPWSPVA